MSLSQPKAQKKQVRRHKAAIKRTQFSRPVRLALEHSVLSGESCFFDYGCGRGDDLRLLKQHGISALGWDPYYAAEETKSKADVVNIGYVLNVIEDPEERRRALAEAWSLAGSALLVSAQVLQDRRESADCTEFGDGVITRLGTFQKYFEHSELGQLIEQVIGTEPIPAALGVYFAFRDEQAALGYRARRYKRRSRGCAPRVRRSVKRFEDNRTLLDPLVLFMQDHGRVPEPEECQGYYDALITEFGSVARAFSLVKRVTGKETWEAVAQERREDLLVFLALARFRRRPRFSDLPKDLQLDIRKLFGAYKRACEQSDEFLFQLADQELIARTCRQSAIGKRMPKHLYVHKDGLGEVDPLLRMYEGCARSFIGEVEDTKIVKFHMERPAISYLEYADFDSDPHPTLLTSIKVDLANRRVFTRDYRDRENPPILHRKEEFVPTGYPHLEKFARLTAQEERFGLLEDGSAIGTVRGWEERLAQRGVELRGHRVVQRKD